MAILNSQFLFFRGRSLSVKLYRYPPKSLMANEIVCWVTIWSLLFSVPFQMKHNFQGGANRNESLPAAANQQQNHEGHRWEILVRQPVSALHLQTQSGKRRDLHRWQIHEVLSHTPTEPLDCGRGQECAAWTGKFGIIAFIWFDVFFFSDIENLQVSEKIRNVLAKEFGASESRFNTSGREDIDVRMLGEGRPFCVEMRDCKRTKQLRGLETRWFQGTTKKNFQLSESNTLKRCRSWKTKWTEQWRTWRCESWRGSREKRPRKWPLGLMVRTSLEVYCNKLAIFFRKA